MTQSDLDLVVARTGHERYRWLTSPENPEADAWRRIVAAKAVEYRSGGPAAHVPLVPSYPSLARRAANLLGSLAGWVRVGFRLANPALARRRRLTCESCPSRMYDPAKRACTVCGCKTSLKPWLASERCPLGHW